MTKKQRYHQLINEVQNENSLEYLTVVCSTRNKAIASKAKRLIANGEYAEALKIADPIGYRVGLNEFQ